MKVHQTELFDCIVVGGGASGMVAAGRIAERGKRVLLIEKNKELGKKLGITGGGRCNILNAEFDTHALLSHFGDSAKFLYSSFSQFGVKDTFTFFERLGLPLVTQARKRAFPKTENAQDVVRVLKDYVTSHHVTIKTNTKVTGIVALGDIITGVETAKTTYQAKTVVFATGGASHKETGSTGDGFTWLRELGHSVKNPSPNIVPIEVEDEWVKRLSGTSLSFMRITFYLDGKKKFFKKGKILFTHFGLSGPLILNSAHQVHEILKGGAVTAKIDAFPDTDLGSLEKHILRIFDKNKNKMLKNVFPEIAPKGTDDVILSLLSVNPEKKVHSVTVEERKEMTHLLKALPINIRGLMGFDRAVISDGGVPLEEVDTKTFQSKRYKNLYLTGDTLHINRPSGGYSLQLCWTSGYVVGENA